MEALYKMSVPCGRMGTLSGIFIADTEDVATKVMGRTVYFGEALGKHSDVVVDFDENDLSVVTTDAEFIAKCKEFKLESGYNPFDYLDTIDDDDDDEA